MNRNVASARRPITGDSADAWVLAQALYLHSRVRVANVDDYAINNVYRSTVPKPGPSPEPGRPYGWLADLDRLRVLLTRAGPHVVSGPGGGCHVWVAPAQPVASVVAPIALGLAAMLLSRDSSPLLNPVTGPLQLPVAPHRLGGRSKVLDGYGLGPACRSLNGGSSIAGTSERGIRRKAVEMRRAYVFLITGSGTIGAMTIPVGGVAPRVPVLVRLPVPTRDGLRDRAALEKASMSGYLESLIRHDLASPDASAFIAIKAPTFASRGKNGTGRPTKGARATVMLRIEPSLREEIHQRAHSLQLTVIDYLESLVSRDISAPAPVGEEMAFAQTA